MAKSKISDYSATPASNTDIDNIDINEGCSPSGINNAIRSLMSHLKNWQGGTSGDTLPIASGGTASTTASAARTALSAAASGANADITSLTGLTTALSVVQGGTGVTTSTGTGAVVRATSPTLVTPLLGTPTSGVLTNCTGLPIVGGGTGGTTAATARTALGLVIGTDILAPPSGTSVLKANSGGALSNATAGTDYVSPSAATSFTAKQTFIGATNAISSKFVNSLEGVTVSATTATGTINYDITTQSVIYYTSNASANWTVNFRASSGTSLDTALATGEAITVVFMVTQGTTAYYNNAITIDGTSVTPKYQGGTTPTAGNVSGIDIYSYTIIKTASATYTVLASQVQFK
jgi:hypothetical protein